MNAFVQMYTVQVYLLLHNSTHTSMEGRCSRHLLANKKSPPPSSLISLVEGQQQVTECQYTFFPFFFFFFTESFTTLLALYCSIRKKKTVRIVFSKTNLFAYDFILEGQSHEIFTAPVFSSIRSFWWSN